MLLYVNVSIHTCHLNYSHSKLNKHFSILQNGR